MLKSSKRFILHTDGLNSQGFRMLTSGAMMEDFLKNPVLLFNHIRPKGNRKNQILPLGYWDDIEVTDGQISGVPVFDDKDEFAKAIYDKVENGVIKMCSTGAEPVETSNAEEVLLPGQKLETVTRWVMKEGSLCDIGANPESLAVALYNDNKLIALSESNIHNIPSSINPDMKGKKLTAQGLVVKNKMVALSAALKSELKDVDGKVIAALEKRMVKLAEDLEKKMAEEDPEKALAEDMQPDNKDKEISDLKASLADCQKQLADALSELEQYKQAGEGEAEKKVEQLCDKAVKDRKITLAEKPLWKKLAEADYETTEATLKLRKAVPSIKSVIEDEPNNEDVDQGRVVELSKKSWDELFKSTGDLNFIKLNAPEVYKAKFKSKFGKEPKNV